MQLKDILLDIRSQIEDGSYRSGLCVIQNYMNTVTRREYRSLLDLVLPYGRYPIPSGNANITNKQAYYTYKYNTRLAYYAYSVGKKLEGFDHKAYKERRLELLDKVIELCD